MNFFKYLLLLIIGLTFFLCAGCTDKKDKLLTSQNPSIICNENEIFKITLPGNPTTGYEWKLKEITGTDTPIIVLEKSEYIQNKKDEKIVGSGGTFVFIFKTKSRGFNQLHFEYARPWEKEKNKTAEFFITVR